MGRRIESDMIVGQAIRANAAEGQKCERRGNFTTCAAENPRYPTVCKRCREALAETEEAEFSNR